MTKGALRDRPVEIEVTDKVIEAGVRALMAHTYTAECGTPDWQEAAIECFTEMLKVARGASI